MNLNLQEVAAALLEAEDVLVISHKTPDGDTTGSASALCTALQQMGKRARFLCADPVDKKYELLFSAVDVQEFEPQIIVTVDAATPSLLGKELAEYVEKIDIVIDHHRSHTMFGKATYLDVTAASTTEAVYDILCAMGQPITTQIANCLYVGLCTDTGCFRYSNVTSKTMRTAAALMEAGAEAAEWNRILFDTKSHARMKVEQMAMESITYYFDGLFTIMEITDEMMEKAGATEGDIEGLAALPRQIEGVVISATLRSRKDGGYKVSMRSTPPVDASAICNVFGGGGHIGAAGCVFEDEKEMVKTKLANAVGAYLNK